MILRELREIDQTTDDILVYGFDGSNNQKIKTDVSGRLDIISDNLDIALSDLKTVLDNIDANTNTLEDKTQSIRDQLDVVSSSRSSEATSLLILSALGIASGTDVITELQNLTSNISDLATEATLIEVRDLLTTIDTNLLTVVSKLDVTLSSRASEATLTSVLSELESIDSKDFATEATSALIKIAVEAINITLDVALSTRASEVTLASVLVQLENLNLVDFSTETTLALIKTAVESIDADLDVALSTRASELTLVDVKTNLDDIKIQLDILNATDFASESTLTEVLNTIGQESGASVLSKLDDVAQDSTSQEILDAIGQISGTDVITELQIISASTEIHNKVSPGKFFNIHLKNAGSFDMNVNGSVTPVDFLFEPPPNKHVFIARLIIMIEDNNINFNKFGGISALTNGFFIKVTEDGGERDLHDSIIKKNSDFHMLAYDVSIDSAVTDLLSVRWTFAKAGTFLHLHNDTLDNFKVTIADNLTGLIKFHMTVQGFEVDE